MCTQCEARPALSDLSALQVPEAGAFLPDILQQHLHAEDQNDAPDACAPG